MCYLSATAGLWNIGQNELEWGQNGELFDYHHGLKLRKDYEWRNEKTENVDNR